MPGHHEPSRHWNAYRPAYDDERPRLPSTRPSTGYEAAHENPNSLPLGRRREPSHYSDQRRSASPSPITKVNDNTTATPDAESLWPASLDDLMGRTSRACDVVINYERDSDGGTRWSRLSIMRIQHEAHVMHKSIRQLKLWIKDLERARAEPDLLNKDVEGVTNLCEYVLRSIASHEKKSAGEIRAKEMREWAEQEEWAEERADAEMGGVGEWKVKGQAEVKAQEGEMERDGEASSSAPMQSSAVVKQKGPTRIDPITREMLVDLETTSSIVNQWPW